MKREVELSPGNPPFTGRSLAKIHLYCTARKQNLVSSASVCESCGVLQSKYYAGNSVAIILYIWNKKKGKEKTVNERS